MKGRVCGHAYTSPSVCVCVVDGRACVWTRLNLALSAVNLGEAAEACLPADTMAEIYVLTAMALKPLLPASLQFIPVCDPGLYPPTALIHHVPPRSAPSYSLKPPQLCPLPPSNLPMPLPVLLPMPPVAPLRVQMLILDLVFKLTLCRCIHVDIEHVPASNDSLQCDCSQAMIGL